MVDRESLVIDSQTVQNGRVEIVDVHRIVNDVVTKVVGLAVIKSRLESASSDAGRKASAMMITTIIIFGQLALAVDRSSEFPAKYHHGIL